MTPFIQLQWTRRALKSGTFGACHNVMTVRKRPVRGYWQRPSRSSITANISVDYQTLARERPKNRSGRTPSIGTIKGNEAPGVTWRFKPKPRNRNRGRGLGSSLAKGSCFPQTLHPAQAKVPDQSSSLAGVDDSLNSSFLDSN